jgi:hypothetical protein
MVVTVVRVATVVTAVSVAQCYRGDSGPTDPQIRFEWPTVLQKDLSLQIL